MVYDNIKKRGRRIKGRKRPGFAKNLEEFGKLLETPEGKNHLFFDGGEKGKFQLITKVITVKEKDWLEPKKKKGQKKPPVKRTGDPKSTILVIADRELLERLVRNREETIDLYLDGTFSINPQGLEICQTYIMQGGSNNKVSITLYLEVQAFIPI